MMFSVPYETLGGSGASQMTGTAGISPYPWFQLSVEFQNGTFMNKGAQLYSLCPLVPTPQ